MTVSRLNPAQGSQTPSSLLWQRNAQNIQSRASEDEPKRIKTQDQWWINGIQINRDEVKLLNTIWFGYDVHKNMVKQTHIFSYLKRMFEQYHKRGSYSEYMISGPGLWAGNTNPFLHNSLLLSEGRGNHQPAPLHVVYSSLIRVCWQSLWLAAQDH